MVYERVPPPPPQVNIWEFEQIGEPSPDDLVVICFENGDRLHVARDKTRAWRPDRQLMPSSLREILATHGNGFSISRGFAGMTSGYVGGPLLLTIRGAARGWHEKLVFVSEGSIRTIRSQPRQSTMATQLCGEVALWNDYDARQYARDLKDARS